ncbi:MULTISPECIES: phosphoribosylamine--glycine ligase [unclassified Thermosynechococcus]|uniref:phosphoribosylamine--glycine ligase n=1 Tax=unclassified Thermosynechococcus TaxID=2622553 RepID=UPI001A01E6F2|nr:MULTISPECIES: phosphoribosylamine--glycine ligase [unclassified Thermosynechococcus]HIK22824.1 phosphoribosylamine--glycine ligase [Thermosynechococcus sp. M3746_W2019_013]
MKVVVVGSGGREHAIAWKLLDSHRVTQVYCLPGNGGTACLERCENVAIEATDLTGISEFAKENNADLVVVGPEVPLAAGLGDRLQALKIPVFGPGQAGAQIEASKAWAKALMEAAQIPTAQAAVFDNYGAASRYVQAKGAPIVIKADGLAAGKGVTVAATEAEAIAALERIFGGEFGVAGQKVVIESVLEGQEVSVLAVTDGKTILPLLPAQDHKRIGEGDTGPNTGGMGVYAPVPWVTPELMRRIQRTILEPALGALQDRGIHYCGVLYAGLMVTPAGDPYVVEFNCRFGDPETQVVLPLLETPLIDVILACVEGRLASLGTLQWRNEVALCVVMAAGGYPGSYRKGDVIQGIPEAMAQGVLVFHAGTRWQEGQWYTNGGRVLNITALAPDFATAQAKAYGAVNVIEFADCYYRRDIGYRILESSAHRGEYRP